MRAYHLTSEKWGIEALTSRRLKLARLEDLNDPFELLGIELPRPNDRKAFNALKAEMHETIGLLCFSRRWRNPVLWSHYGDKHRGLCLGFDIPTKWAKPMSYQGKRLPASIEHDVSRGHNKTTGYKLLTTKYEHWRYEDEVRLIVKLVDAVRDGEHYFVPFGPALRLREVVTGHRSKILGGHLQDVTSSEEPKVSIIHGRMAFRSFKVVKNLARRVSQQDA